VKYKPGTQFELYVWLLDLTQNYPKLSRPYNMSMNAKKLSTHCKNESLICYYTKARCNARGSGLPKPEPCNLSNNSGNNYDNILTE
jgi:hypothetical protein